MSVVEVGSWTHRSRWAAIGAAIAVSIGGGGLMSASASIDSGERAVFVPITPCRLMDTRPATQVGPRGAAIGAGETYTVVVRGQNGQCDIPTDAVGVVMNVTAVNPTVGSFLTVFPADAAARPNASNLNWVGGQPPVSNAVTADLSADGKISFYNLGGTVDLAADVVGYFADHHHDDRYVRRVQTLVFSGLGLNFTFTAQLGTTNGCATHFAGSGWGFLPLDLPIGARILSANVTVYESTGTYTADLQRVTITGTGMNATNLATVSSSAASGTTVVKSLDPLAPETVDSGENFVIRFEPGGSGFSNGICQATVTVDLSTSP